MTTETHFSDINPTDVVLVDGKAMTVAYMVMGWHPSTPIAIVAMDDAGCLHDLDGIEYDWTLPVVTP